MPVPEYVHVDVMDGHFVPNITIGAPVVKALRKATDKVLDVHLMISDPDQYLDGFIKAGSGYHHPYTTSPTVIRSSSRRKSAQPVSRQPALSSRKPR